MENDNVGIRDWRKLTSNSVENYTIKDMMSVISLNLEEFLRSKDENYVTDALNLLDTILLTYKCEKIDEHYLFTPNHELFVISTPIYVGR